MRERAIRRLCWLVARLGRPYRTEFVEAMLWSALRNDGRRYTDDAGYETRDMVDRR